MQIILSISCSLAAAPVWFALFLNLAGVATVRPEGPTYHAIRTAVSDDGLAFTCDYAPVNMFLGGSGWTPVAGDFDGDWLSDPAVYSGGRWDAMLSSAGYASVSFEFGNSAAIPVS